MSTSNKLTALFLLLAVTLGYSLFHKKRLESYFTESLSPILKQLPDRVELKKFSDGSNFDLLDEARSSNGLIVHFWGTWCAPCEYELPEFLEFSKKLSAKNVKVVLLAVNDNDLKIKKFLKRFPSLTSNITVVHDKFGLSMKKFGVVKVPETFLFSKTGTSLKKFSGPQDWQQESYYKRVLRYLAL